MACHLRVAEGGKPRKGIGEDAALVNENVLHEVVRAAPAMLPSCCWSGRAGRRRNLVMACSDWRCCRHQSIMHLIVHGFAQKGRDNVGHGSYIVISWDGRKSIVTSSILHCTYAELAAAVAAAVSNRKAAAKTLLTQPHGLIEGPPCAAGVPRYRSPLILWLTNRH